MIFSLEPTKAQLKVFSNICGNFVVVWLIAAFASKDPFVLTRDLLVAILGWYAAVKTEEEIERK